MFRLDGQAAFITGGGRGIGQAAAFAFAAAGAAVGVADIDGSSAEETAARIVSGGGSACAFAINVANRDAVADAAQHLMRKFGRLDAIVNSAIAFRYEPVAAVSEDTWQRMTSVGLSALIWTAQAAERHMDPERGGLIVNFSSPVADRGHAGTAVYSTIKGGVVAMTRALAVEFGPRRIRVNAICPGAVPTPGGRTLSSDAVYEARRQRTPLGRLGTPEEIGAMAVFLATPAASLVTGEILHIDGGATMRGE